MEGAFSCLADSGLLAALEESARKDGIQKMVGGAVMLNARGEVLLLKRASDDFMGGLVELPSDNVDAGETLLEGLVREFREETGLSVGRVERYVGSFDYLSGSGKKARQFNFQVRPAEEAPVALSGEHIEHYWVDPRSERFAALNVSEHTRTAIRAAAPA